MSKAILADADGVVISGGDSGSRSGIKIERVESEKKGAKDVAWSESPRMKPAKCWLLNWGSNLEKDWW